MEKMNEAQMDSSELNSSNCQDLNEAMKLIKNSTDFYRFAKLLFNLTSEHQKIVTLSLHKII